jgi:3-hydroxyisobutyrate dehydrogenase
MDVGFIGLGVMGQPMALHLARAGAQRVVWRRSADRWEPLRAVGAAMAESASEVFARVRMVILMLRDAAAIDSVLGRGTPVFARNVAQHTIVHMGTTAPACPREPETEILSAGGACVEARILGALAAANRTHSAARAAGASTPLLGECIAPYHKTRALGAGELDLVAVIKSMEARDQ